MGPLDRERQENVAGWMVRMWHLEDVLRASRFDEEGIRRSLVAPMEADASTKRSAEAWYLALAARMRNEGIEGQGHLSEVEETLRDLESLHQALLDRLPDAEYAARFAEVEDDLRALRAQSDEREMGPVETCFTGIYGVMLLRTQGREVGEATRAADERLRALLAVLSERFRHLRKLPGISLN